MAGFVLSLPHARPWTNASAFRGDAVSVPPLCRQRTARWLCCEPPAPRRSMESYREGIRRDPYRQRPHGEPNENMLDASRSSNYTRRSRSSTGEPSFPASRRDRSSRRFESRRDGPGRFESRSNGHRRHDPRGHSRSRFSANRYERDGEEEMARVRPAEASNGTTDEGVGVRAKVGLVKAMMRANVSSQETCELLVRNGMVTLNGAPCTEASATVNMKEDLVIVSGREIDLEEALRRIEVREKVASDEYGQERFEEEEEGEYDDSFNDSMLPRSQRDFKNRRRDLRGNEDGYRTSLDGGFFASRKFYGGR